MSVTAAQAAVVVAPPTFSAAHGFRSAPFALGLSSATSGASIRYTTNGATPSPTVGSVYTAPFTISTTTPVRAIAYVSDTDKSAVVAQTYLFTADVRKQPNNPPGYPNAFAKADSESKGAPYPADYEMDPEVVNNSTYSSKIEPALKAIPSVSITTDVNNLFDAVPGSSPSTPFGIYSNPNEKGSAWERPVSIEWIDPKGGSDFTENAGVRIHGQASRRPQRTPKKSFRVYFKTKYGSPKLDFRLFDTRGEQFTPVSSFDGLILRNGGNRSWPYFDRFQRRETDYVNDEWARNAHLDMGRLSPHGTYAHLYINGLYWGLYVAERPDEKFVASYLGGNPDTDIDNIVADEDFGNAPTADAGNLDAYNEAVSLLAGSAPVSSSLYATLSTKIDMGEMADYFLLTHYIAKTDWPHHNWNMFRRRTGEDTRFKFMMWDADSGLNKVTENTTKLADPNGWGPQPMFERLMTNGEFRQLVGDRLRKHLLTGGALSPEACSTRYTTLKNMVDQPVIGESARWGDYVRDVYHWDTEGKESWPAYLHTRDLSGAATDPSGNPAGPVPDDQQKNWTQVVADKLANYCPNRGAELIKQYKSNGWYSDTLAPSVSISAPASGATIPNGSAQTITATASDSDGTVSSVVFRANGVDIPGCRDTTAPYACPWMPTSAGTVALTAVASDNGGGSTTSVPINVTVSAGSGGSGAFVESGGQVVMEAENYTDRAGRSAHDWTAQGTPAGFSGRATMASLPNNGANITASPQTTSPQLDWQVDVTTTGPYNLWVRGYGVNGSDDSLHAGLNGVVAGSPSVTGAAWIWKKAGTVTLGDGIQTVSAWMREDGTVLDKLLLTRATTTPNGVGPAESPRNGGGGGGGGGPVNVAPSVSITAPPAGTTVTAGTPVPVEASANDSDGTVAQVAFKVDGAPISGCNDASVPFQCAFTPSAPGTYTLTATATDDDGDSSTSPGIIITANPTGGGGGGSGGSAAYLESGGQVTMEAEAGTITGRGGKTWSPSSLAGYGGTGGLVTTPNTGVTVGSTIATTSPSVALPVSISRAETYTMWVRAAGPTGSDDSLYIGADGTPGASVAVSGAAWFWKKAGTISLAAGAHTVSVWMREDGVLLDRVMLTRSTSFTPTGIGPAESPRAP